MLKSRSLLVFENAIKSEETKKIYLYWLDKFREYAGAKNYDSLLLVNSKELQTKLEDYLFELKNTYSRATIESIFYAIELFYSMNDVILNFKKIRKMYPPLEKRLGQEAYTTQDVQKILESAKSRKTRALIHLLAASGIRIGAVESLKLKHIKPMKHGCRSVLVYADTKDEYTTFITPEAAEALDSYITERRKMGEEITQESPVFAAFRNKTGLGKVEHLSYSAARTLLHRAVNQAHIEHVIKNKRHNVPVAHGFRKRFNTILKSNNNINSNLVEKLMGHSTTIKLDNNYLKPSIDTLFAEYVKGIADLVISDELRQKIEIERQHQEITELKQSEIEIKVRDAKIVELQEKTKRIPELEHIIKKQDEEIDKKIEEKIQQFGEEFIKRLTVMQDETRKKLDEVDEKAIKRIKEITSETNPDLELSDIENY